VRQFTALDRQFLALEDSRNYGHVGALSIYDPSTAPRKELTLPRLQSLIAERLPLVPPFRWRLAEVEAHHPVMSYCGHLDFGIVADREQTPDVWSLMGWLTDALEELRPRTTPHTKRKPAKMKADG
jgi:hypothetical protein